MALMTRPIPAAISLASLYASAEKMGPDWKLVL